jgi:hypothetical protein
MQSAARSSKNKKLTGHRRTYGRRRSISKPGTTARHNHEFGIIEKVVGKRSNRMAQCDYGMRLLTG